MDMPKVIFHVFMVDRLQRESKIHASVIKALGLSIQMENNQRLHKKYNKTIEYQGTRYSVAYEFQEDDAILIREAKKVRRK